MPYPQFETILLAAGMSARMGTQNKLLMEIDGIPLVRASAALYCKFDMPVTVILGHEANAVKAALQGLPVKTVQNTDYASGQTSSIHAGLGAASLKGEALLMALADQPLLKDNDISSLCETFLKSPRDKILLPRYKGERGNPVLLPVSIAKRLAADKILPRAFMDENPEQVAAYPAPNAHFTRDIDTPEDAKDVLGELD